MPSDFLCVHCGEDDPRQRSIAEPHKCRACLSRWSCAHCGSQTKEQSTSNPSVCVDCVGKVAAKKGKRRDPDGPWQCPNCDERDESKRCSSNRNCKKCQAEYTKKYRAERRAAGDDPKLNDRLRDKARRRLARRHKAEYEQIFEELKREVAA